MQETVQETLQQVKKYKKYLQSATYYLVLIGLSGPQQPKRCCSQGDLRFSSVILCLHFKIKLKNKIKLD